MIVAKEESEKVVRGKVGSLELPTCIETNRRINYARCNCFLFTAGRIGHANGGDWHAVRDSRANGNELFLCRERVGPWHWSLDCLRLEPKRGDLARWSNATMTVRWPYRDPIVSTRRAISDVFYASQIISRPLPSLQISLVFPPISSRSRCIKARVIRFPLLLVDDKYDGKFLDSF